MRRKALLTAIILAMTISYCAPDYNKLLREPEKQFYTGHPKEAARTFISHMNKSGKDQLLFLMEAGLMLHTTDDYKTSNKIFLKASKVSAKMGTSVTKQAASLFLNERSTNYRGEDFERVLIHMYLGINFIMLNKPENARVEFKRVNNELNRISKESGKRYKQNIMAKYLTAVAYEMTGDLEKDSEDWEFAYIEYKQIYQLRPGLAMVHRDLQRMSKKLGYMDDYKRWTAKLGRKDKIPTDSGELIVIYQAGRSAIKKSRGPIMSDRSMAAALRTAMYAMPLQAGVTVGAISVSLNQAENPIPRFSKRSNKIRSMNIVIDGRQYGPSIMLEDIENTAVQNLRDDYGRIKKKVAAGIVTKIAASIAAGMIAKEVAEQAGAGAFSGLIGMMAGAGTGSALISQIKPDLRCWHSLPANLQLKRIFIKPGKYTIKLQFRARNGAIVRTETDNIEIKKGKKSFVNYRTLY